jgi:hypothetical protein
MLDDVIYRVLQSIVSTLKLLALDCRLCFNDNALYFERLYCAHLKHTSVVQLFACYCSSLPLTCINKVCKDMKCCNIIL